MVKNNDYAIEYNAKIYEVKTNIETLEKTSIKITNFNEAIDKIQSEVTKQIEEAYISFYSGSNVSNNTFLYDVVAKIYSDAISKLDKINDYILSEYNSYYEVETLLEDIESRIIDIKDKKTYDINISSDAINLLKNLRGTTSIDFNEEKDLVEKVYKTVYNAMKLELLYSTDTLLFNYVKLNDVDSINISKLVKEDVSNFNNYEIDRIIKRINRKGLDSKNYVDIDLITSLLNTNPYDNEEKELLDKIDEYFIKENELKEKESSKITITNSLKEKIKEKKKLVLTKARNIGIVTLPTAIFLAGGIAIGVIGHKNAPYTAYKTITETYDTETDTYNKYVEYEKAKEDSIEIKETAPSEENTVDDIYYKYSVNTYSLDDSYLNWNDIRDYLTINKDEYITISSSKHLTKKHDITEEDLKNIQYQITRIIQDKNDSTEKENLVYLFPLTIYAIIAFIIDTLITLYIALKLDIIDFREDVHGHSDLIITNNLTNKIYECDNNIIDIEDNLEKLEKEINDIISNINIKREDILSVYYNLPAYIKEKEEIKAKILKLRNDKTVK